MVRYGMSFVELFDRINAATAADAALVEAVRAGAEASSQPLPEPIRRGPGTPAVAREVPGEMYEHDAVMARESAQQGLVDEVGRDLNLHFGAARDVSVRMRTLQALLAMAHGIDPEPWAGLDFLRLHVALPVGRFATGPAEARALLVRVAGKVFGGLSADAEGGLLRETFLSR